MPFSAPTLHFFWPPTNNFVLYFWTTAQPKASSSQCAVIFLWNVYQKHQPRVQGSGTGPQRTCAMHRAHSIDVFFSASLPHCEMHWSSQRCHIIPVSRMLCKISTDWHEGDAVHLQATLQGLAMLSRCHSFHRQSSIGKKKNSHGNQRTPCGHIASSRNTRGSSDKPAQMSG